MATWPSTLPAPVLEGYGLGPVDPTIRTDMEVGAARVRRRTSARNDRVAVSWVFTPAQLSAFRTWFDSSSEAAGGASWFNILLDIGGGAAQTVEARFTAIWKAERAWGKAWRVTANLEVR